MGHATAATLTAGHLVGAAATVVGVAAVYCRDRVAGALRRRWTDREPAAGTGGRASE
jgi:hypothetical protein